MNSNSLPKLPIILCHGPSILKSWRISYWHGVLQYLRRKGCQVYVAKVPSVGPIHIRAKYLQQFILQSAFQGRASLEGGVHLVAHSMGGLDARYFISILNANASEKERVKIRSLSTIATPHKGSILADYWIEVLEGSRDLATFEPCKKEPHGAGHQKHPRWADHKVLSISSQYWTHLILYIVQSFLIHNMNEWKEVMNFDSSQYPSFVKYNPIVKLDLDMRDSPFGRWEKDTGAIETNEWKMKMILYTLYHLSPTFMNKHFNPHVLDDPAVIYHSYMGDVGDASALLMWPFGACYKQLRKAEGPNDTFVSTDSAAWGKVKGIYPILHHEFVRVFKVWPDFDGDFIKVGLKGKSNLMAAAAAQWKDYLSLLHWFSKPNFSALTSTSQDTLNQSGQEKKSLSASLFDKREQAGDVKKEAVSPLVVYDDICQNLAQEEQKTAAKCHFECQ